MDRRSFGLAAPFAAASALSASAALGNVDLGDARRSSSVALARSYFALYNDSNWMGVGNLFIDRSQFFSNSGYFVQDSPFVGGMASGHEEVSGSLIGSEPIVDYLRKRRAATNEQFYIWPDGEQFWTPFPTTVVAWMAKPGAGSRLRGPSYEVHVFTCELELAGEAVISSKIFSIHEMNLDRFEYGRG